MHKCIWRSVFVPICVHFPSTEGNEKMAWNTYFWGLLWRVNGAKIWSLCAWIYAWMNSNLFFTVNRNLFECFKHDIAYGNSMLWMFASIFMVFCQLLTSFVLVNNYQRLLKTLQALTSKLKNCGIISTQNRIKIMRLSYITVQI